MKKAIPCIYLDKNRPKQNGLCSIKIKITFNRKRKYYSTGIAVSIKDFDQAFYGRRKTQKQKEVKTKVEYFENKAANIIAELPVFSFYAFEERYFDQRHTTDGVSYAFDKYIESLKLEQRVKTAESYENAKVSLSKFNKDLTFGDVTPILLRRYENWMLKQGKSISTIGIYLRSLRTIYNLQNINNDVYPFGKGKGKYSIPTSKNIKKALTLDEVGKIYNYQAIPNSAKDRAKDYWLFLYLCNGMNVKDFCLLKWANIDENMLNYKREKTKRSQRKSKLITVALKPESLEIIKKWGQLSLNKDSYIFPHIKKEMNPEQRKKVFYNVTKTINKYLKEIAKEIGINKKVTTYFARHSFATILKRSGTTTEMISELLGHSNIHVTESYLDSFENEQIQKETDILTKTFKKVN